MSRRKRKTMIKNEEGVSFAGVEEEISAMVADWKPTKARRILYFLLNHERI